MPKVLHRTRLRDALKPFESKAILASLVCSLVLVVAVAGLWRPGAGTPRLPAPNSPPPAACDAPDQSFCPVQSQFSKYVIENGFSDILGQQTPVQVDCAHESSVCAGRSNYFVQAYSVQQGDTISLFTRNDYIGYFLRYSSQYGPFRFSKDMDAGSTVRMVFAGRSARTLSLRFERSGGTWRLIVPITN
jgi:hypothetical protein